MRKLFSILAILFFAISFGQNQTLNGVKTFTSPPKFLNLQQSTVNTKFLTLNSNNQLMWSNVTGIQDAPSNGTLYARQNGSWSAVPSATTKEWIGYIYQDGTNTAPTTNAVYKNTLSGITVNSTWTRNEVGSYSLVLPFLSTHSTILVEIYKDGDIGSVFPYDTHLRYKLSSDVMTGTQITILSSTEISGIESPVELGGAFKLRIYQY